MKVRLKELRTLRGLSQNRLAQQAGMTLQNLQKIEYGKTKGIQFNILSKLCKVLDCQPGDLLIEIPDNDDEQIAAVEREVVAKQEELLKLKQTRKTISSSANHRYQSTRSFLTVVRQAQDSA